jgi:hypothetical protein
MRRVAGIRAALFAGALCLVWVSGSRAAGTADRRAVVPVHHVP